MRSVRRFPALILLSVLSLLVTGLHSASVSVPGEEVRADAGHTFLSLSGPETARPGENATYTVILRSDISTVRLLEVTMTLPEAVNIVEASDGGRREGNLIVWSPVPVDSSTERRLYVSISIDPNARNGATMSPQVTADGEHAAATTRIVTGDVYSSPRALRFSVSDGKDVASPEEVLRYVIPVENISPNTQTFTLRVDLPSNISFLSATGNYRNESGKLQWYDETIRSGDVREFEITAFVDRSAPDFMSLVTKASINGFPMSDATVVRRSQDVVSFDVAVSHDQDQAAPGSEIAYQIHLRNNGPTLATDVDVSAALSTFAEFVDASNGGVWTGRNIRWSGITVSPFGERVLTVIAHVRNDAPLGAELRMSAETIGRVAVDIVTVCAPTQAGNPSQVARGEGSALLRKVADKTEVRPGDVVTYTIFLKNRTDHTFTNVRIEDRMDSGLIRLLGSEGGQQSGNQLIWQVPELLPGQSWSVSYRVQISASAPQGTMINNVVSVSGEGLEPISLSERVFTSRVGIVTHMPSTGAAFDALFLIISGIAGAGQTFFLKRKLM